MNLEVNQNHKKIDLSKLKRPLKRFAAGSQVALSLYSGVLPQTVYATEPTSISIENIDENTVIEIPENIRYDVASKVGKKETDPITVKDLQSITNLFFSVYEPTEDLSFLNYCTNLKSLMIICHCDGLEYFNSIDSLPSLDTLMISNMWNEVIATKDNLEFLKKCPNLRELNMMGVDVYPGCEEALNVVEELSVAFGQNCDLDFNKLTGIKTLDLSGAKPYDIAIYLNSEEYNTLINNGVNIVFENEEAKQKYLDASRKLDEIVKSLGVTKESTDREKLDAILIYALENLEYDAEVAKQSDENGRADRNLVSTFYQDGMLYGALEKDTAICGNYAALVEALSDRLSVPKNSYIMESDNHAWNLMNIDGQLYYVDATWLDGQKFYTMVLDEEDSDEFSKTYRSVEQKTTDIITAGEYGDLKWYMEPVDANYISTIDEKNSHVPEMTIPGYVYEDATFAMERPTYGSVEEEPYVEQQETEQTVSTESQQQVTVETQPLEEETEIKETDGNTKVKVTINGKTIIISIGALVGVMTAVGAAVAVHSNKEKKRRERLRRQQEMYGMFNDPFGSSYGSYQSPSSSTYQSPYNTTRRH